MNFGLLFQKWSLGTQKLFWKVLDQLDTRLNNYGLISSQSMLIYHLKLKQLYLENGCSDRKNKDIFDRKGLNQSLIGQFWPYMAWWYQISQNKNFVLLFQKWSLGTQESFCKVSDQLDTQLNNYGLISWHTSSINCVNNCTFIFTRHQPRLFLKALLVILSVLCSSRECFIMVLIMFILCHAICGLEIK